MRRQLNLMLGLPDDAGPFQMKKRYQMLMAALFALDERDSRYEDRLGKARERLSRAYESYKRALPEIECDCVDMLSLSGIKSEPPLIGELLIEARLISRADLDRALEYQANSNKPVPLGSLLVNRQLITWDQLAFFLRLQDLLKLSPVDRTRMSRQLLDLGILTPDEVQQAELDCEIVGCSFQHAITRRGWVKEQLLNTLAPMPV